MSKGGTSVDRGCQTQLHVDLGPPHQRGGPQGLKKTYLCSRYVEGLGIAIGS